MLELEQAKQKSTYLEYATSLYKLELLVNDDFVLKELDLGKCCNPFVSFCTPVDLMIFS